MSFRFGTPWNFWLLLSAGVTVTFIVLSSKLSQHIYSMLKIFLSCLLTAALLFDAVISGGGLFVAGGQANPFGTMAFAAGLISPLAMLVSLISMRWAAIIMWLLFLIQHAYFSWINWPHLYGVAMAISFDWPLLMSALILSVIALQDKRRKRPLAPLCGFS